MADIEIVDEVVDRSSGGAGGGGRQSRAIVEESITLGERDAKVSDRGTGREVVDDDIRLGGPKGRKFSESTKKLLANIDKHGTVEDPPEGEAPAADAAAPKTDPPPAAPGASAAGPTPGSPEATPQPGAAPADPGAEFREANERLSRHNRELAAEVERYRGAGGKREPSTREKALDEIERGYLDDPIGAIRRLQALAMGIDDPAHKDIDSELSGLYQDLTVRELGVSLDDSKQASREAARTRQILAREKRERKAEQEAASKPKDDPEAQHTAEHTQIIGNRLSSKLPDGKTYGETYPATMKLAEKLAGVKPEALLLREIRAGFKTGEYDPKQADEKLIEQAAAKIEAQYRNFYQVLADVFGGASPSTAQPTPAAIATANNEPGQGHGARTITNASASVAPATPPAKKPEPKTPEKPKWKNEKERRQWLARQHAGEN